MRAALQELYYCCEICSAPMKNARNIYNIQSKKSETGSPLSRGNNLLLLGEIILHMK